MAKHSRLLWDDGGLRLRTALALGGALALFVWGMAVWFDTGIGYDAHIEGLSLFPGEILWQALRRGFLVILSFAAAKEIIEGIELRRAVNILNEQLNGIASDKARRNKADLSS